MPQEERQTSIRYPKRVLPGEKEIQQAVNYWERVSRLKVSVHLDDSSVTLTLDHKEPLSDEYFKLWLESTPASFLVK